MKTPPDLEIADFGDPNGPSPPKNLGPDLGVFARGPISGDVLGDSSVLADAACPDLGVAAWDLACPTLGNQ